MADKQTFRAVIEDPGNGGAFISIPFDVEKVYGAKRVKVKATIDGEPYRGIIVRMGTVCHILIVLKEIRAKIGKTFGDEVEITLEKDEEVREVILPPDLKAAFQAAPEAEAYFTKLSYTHQKEYVQWIDEAKRDLTRTNRIEKTVQMLLDHTLKR